MSPIDLLERLERVRQVPGGWQARCPAHPDRDPSLSVSTGEDGRILLTCFAGCDTGDVVGAVGLTMRDLFADSDGARSPRPADRPRFVRPQPSPADVDQLGVFVQDAARRIETAEHRAAIYARQRFGLGLADVKRLQLGYTDTMGGGPRLVVPFCTTWGVPAGLQARALNADASVRWLSPKNPSVGTWSRIGWFRGRDGRAPIFVTEGPGDALTAVALGFNAIGIRGAGNAADPETQHLVRSWIGRNAVVLAGDGDEAGERFNDALERSLRLLGVRPHLLPMPPKMDLTDLRRENTAALDEALRRAGCE